jgi:signal transduction histidine kinase
VDGSEIGKIFEHAEGGARPATDDRDRTLDRAARMQSLLEALAAAVDTRDVVRAAVERGAEVTRASGAGIWLRGGADGSTLELANVVGVTGSTREQFAQVSTASDPATPLGDVFRTGKPICLGSRAEIVARYPHMQEYAHSREEFAAAGMPLVVAGQTIGVMAFSFQGPREFDVDQKTIMLIVAGHAAQGLQRAQLFDRERQRLAELKQAKSDIELLYALTDAVNRAPALDGVYDPALDALSARLAVDRCAVLLFDADGVIRFKAWKGLSDAYRRAVEGHSPWRPDTPDATAIVVPDVTAEPTLAPFQRAFAAENIAALVFVPLVHAKRVVGKFMLYSAARRTFTATEVKMAQTIADQVAAAVIQKQTQADRERLIDELTRTVRVNELLAGILGHDLRNPLQAIVVSAETLVRRYPDPKLGGTARRIINAGHRMNRMIEQLLDFTRVRVAGTLPIDAEATDLAALWVRAIEELPPAEAERVRLQHQGATAGWWDADRLAQVASNLVGNALRHGSAGAPVTITIDGADAATVTILVHNAGEIPPDLAPKIFEPFQSGERQARRGNGLGLGLFITREIVTAHRGSVDVRSSAEHGTTFVVNLPRGGAPP